MQKFPHLLFSLLLIVAAAFAPCLRAADGSVRQLGDIIINTNATPVHISGPSPELEALARTAFASHGYFRVEAGTGGLEIRFTQAGAQQVSVQVIKNGSVTLNQTLAGSSPRNALLRAADAAVKSITGLNGFFASRLAFVSNRTGKDEIYVGDLFMGEVRQLTSDNAFALTPRWSPDGTRILYTSYMRSFPDIYMINLATNNRTKFASFQGTNSGARFSPDGSRVVMVLSGEGIPEIYSCPASGRPVSRLTRSDAVKSSPCYSPDGSRIVYAAEPGPQLYIMSAAGGSGSRVGGVLGTYCSEPDWSRAAPNKIAYSFRDGSGRFQIAVADLGSGQSKKVSKAPYDGVEPCWLADGRHLIYTARAAGSRGLFILDTESGRTIRLGNIQAEKASVVGP
jgi:TolB protein